MKKILIADDELEFVNDFAKGLQMFGYDVIKAGDGESAVAMVEQHKPDVVLCDYRLPDLDGDKILTKAKEIHPQVKFVVITAYYDEAVKKRLKSLGADDVIFKPIVLMDIKQMLEKM